MIRKKKTWLRCLQVSLIWWLPSREVREILSDYDSFFAAGLAEGRTEAELCRQFGPPVQVARSVLREEGRRRGLPGLFAIIWMLLALHLTGWHSWGFWAKDSLHYLLLFLLMPALVLFGRNGIPDAPALSPGGKKQLTLLFVIPLALWLCNAGFNVWCLASCLTEQVPVPFGIPAPMMGRATWWVYVAVCFCISVLLFLSLLLAWTESPWFFAAGAHCIGALTSLGLFTAHFRSMSLTAADLVFPALCFRPLLSYLVLGFCGTAVTALYIRMQRGGCRGRTA